MKSKGEKVICCEVTNIHRPKPKKLYKINDCKKGHNRWAHGPKKIPNYNNEYNKKKYNNKKLDFESISIEEIEKDFMDFKAKEEELKVEKELYKLLMKPSCNEKTSFINRKKENKSPEENIIRKNSFVGKQFINKNVQYINININKSSINSKLIIIFKYAAIKNILLFSKTTLS